MSAESLGFSPGTPEWIVSIVGLLGVYAVVIFPSVALMSWLERKLIADFQARVGPNRAGPAGFFQPIADLLKLLQKDTRYHWSWREGLWLAVHTMALYSTVAVIPLGSSLIFVNTDMSAFLPFWAALVLALGTMLLGFSQKSVNGWFGGVRVGVQALAGALPALVCMLCAGVRAGSFRWTDLASSQGGLPLGWTAFSNPFQFVAFVVFVASGLVLLSIAPTSGGLSRIDLHGGVSAELSGRRLSLFRLGRFYVFFLWSVIAVVIFLGAWILPGNLAEIISQQIGPFSLAVIELVCVLVKAYALMMGVVWLSRVVPHGRVDQITNFAWRVLSPFSLAALMGAAIWAGWRALL
ncbi:MAG: NADH-quinone oxidoreductase subunit H [Oligoflexia bacterium]|nr:NADH-quinone oxidoreductase subunit H [Oligoflexia bacterium]